jgi:uncharacterized membrane protein
MRNKLSILPTLLLLLALAGCGIRKESEVPVEPPRPAAPVTSFDAQTGDAGADLIIPVSGISETATYYPVTVEGTDMEVIAVKAPDGSIRTAFNTCQICYDSGRGYYEQDGDELVCQNCGNRFKMNQVEVEFGGCNPWPIFSGDKAVTDETITISYDFLQESRQIFANWKRSY